MSDGGGATDDDVRRALADALREQRLRIVAGLIRTIRDWDLAEDAVADAAERALLRWPHDGVPDNPAAWLTTTASRRAIDLIRRAGAERTKLTEVAAREASYDLVDVAGESSDHEVVDDRLRLIFTSAHPALSMEARVALTLKVVAGLSTAAVARAFLTTEATMGQRLLRAKRRIANAGIPYRVPSVDLLPERLDGVLAVVYLVFTTGYAAAADADLADEAIRLGHLLCELLPDSDEARGLLALMLLQHSRRHARLVDGELVTLEHQDRSRWDAAMIAEALTWRRAPGVGAGVGAYRLQADLAEVHAVAARAQDTDWSRIVAVYDELLRLVPSPVVELNRAIAVGLATGPEAGLAALHDVAAQGLLSDHHLLAAARADLLARAGRTVEAVTALDVACSLAPTERERRQLMTRRDELRAASR